MKYTRMTGWLVMLGMLVGAQAAVAAPLAKLSVNAGDCDRMDTPVSATLEGVTLPAGAVRLVEVKDGQRTPVACQIEAGSPAKVHFLLVGKTAAKAVRTFELEAGDAPTAEGVKITQDDKVLEIACGQAKVLQYYHALMPPPEGASKLYTRSGFVHPLWSPAGQVLTRIHAPDHFHHMGLWHPWTATSFEDRKIDFWNLNGGKATVRFVKFASTFSGAVFGGFQAAQDLVDLSAPGGEKVALNEIVDVRAWAPPAGQKYWIIDYAFTQKCASSSPVHLLAYRYGGFGFRATAEWNKDNSNYLTSEGKDRATGHASRAKWCICYGKTAAGAAGIEFMSHPDNREHPEPMRIWGQKDSPKGVGDVFFNFCPIQKKDWVMEPGKQYTLRYRLYVYDGELAADAANRLWEDFGHPPVVTVEK